MTSRINSEKMLRTIISMAAGLPFLTISACFDDSDRFDEVAAIPEFDFPTTIQFEENLSSYGIYEGHARDLRPSSDFHLLELSSVLFTDYAYKQRLVKIPDGTQLEGLGDDAIDFPNGTILVKTFYYFQDDRDPSLGKRVIESRLLIKEEGVWNVATYLWNDEQSDATLQEEGHDTQVSWLDAKGERRSTLYHVPSKKECATCHQSRSTVTPLGPTLRNLNREVERNGVMVNQIRHLQSVGIFNEFSVEEISQIADYKNANLPLEERGRAYLAMNCAHCHNPDGWEAASNRRFDFRYETPLHATGIASQPEKISRALLNGRMPFIGTTLLDEEGVNLVKAYLEGL